MADKPKSPTLIVPVVVIRGGLHRADCDGHCRDRTAPASGTGPAQVATDDYRASWDRTFGGRTPTVGQA